MLKENKGIQIRKDREKRHRKRHKDIQKRCIWVGNTRLSRQGDENRKCK